MTHKRILLTGPHRLSIEEFVVDSGSAATGVFSAISLGTERTWFSGSAPALLSGRKSYPYYPGYSNICELDGEFWIAMAPHANCVDLEKVAVKSKLPLDSAKHATSSLMPFTLAPIFSTAVHAVHQARPPVGARVAVLGSGLLAYAIWNVLRLSCFATLIGSRFDDLNGAMEETKAYEDVLEGEDYDYVFEASGKVERIELALRCLRSRGTLILAGLYTQTLRLDPELMFSREIEVRSVRAGGSALEQSDHVRHNRQTNLDCAVRLIANGGLPQVHYELISPGDLAAVYESKDGDRRFSCNVLSWVD